MTVEEYFGDWMSIIDRQELSRVMNILGKEYKVKKICPAQSDVFKSFRLCPLKDLKVVMLGQDF